MRKIEIDALVRAHRGRPRPVAFLHVLRQSKLEEDDQVFLRDHAAELAIPDLLVWRSRCESGFTGAVIRALARVAIEDPAQFEHEVLDAPRFSLEDEEWIELLDLTGGKVPPRISDRIARRGREYGPRAEPPRPAVEGDADLAGFLEVTLDELAFSSPMPDAALDATLAPELIVERARNAFSAEERAVLLEWASAHGVPRKPLVEIAIAAIRAGEHDPRLRAFLVSQLGTRAAWEAHGLDVFLAYLDRGAFASISDLCAQVAGAAGRVGPAEARGPLLAMSAALAAALVHVTREALVGGIPSRAMAALSALACLDVPSRLSRAVHDLLRVQGVDGEIRTLVELNVRLAKHGRGRDTSFESIVAAVHCLADAESGG